MPLGHQDPVWRPGTTTSSPTSAATATAPRARPRVYLYDMSTKKTKAITGPGYLQPVVLARRQVHRRHEDVGVRDGRRDPQRRHRRGGPPADRRRHELGPGRGRQAGDQIAYLHSPGQLVDLELAQLEGSGPTWTVKDAVPLT